MIRKCDECADLAWCNKMSRCIRRDIPKWEDAEAMREYGRRVQELLKRKEIDAGGEE